MPGQCYWAIQNRFYCVLFVFFKFSNFSFFQRCLFIYWALLFNMHVHVVFLLCFGDLFCRTVHLPYSTCKLLFYCSIEIYSLIRMGLYSFLSLMIYMLLLILFCKYNFCCCFLLIYIWLHRGKNTFSHMTLFSKIQCIVYETSIAETWIVNFCIQCTHLTLISITLNLLFRMNSSSLYFKMKPTTQHTHIIIHITLHLFFLND